jgi:hypothetical protein
MAAAAVTRLPTAVAVAAVAAAAGIIDVTTTPSLRNLLRRSGR